VEAARICTACGIQFPPSAQPPRECPICADYGQFVDGLRFDRIYGAFWDRDVTCDAHARVNESADRYVAWIGGRGTDAPVS